MLLYSGSFGNVLSQLVSLVRLTVFTPLLSVIWSDTSWIFDLMLKSPQIHTRH